MNSWNNWMEVFMRTSSVFLLAFLGLKLNLYTSVYVCLNLHTVHKTSMLLKIFDQWHVCMSVWMCVSWIFLKTFLFPTVCVDGSWKQQLCAVEVCRTPQWNWNWWLLFCLFFPFQKNCCAEPRIVLLVVNAAVASC